MWQKVEVSPHLPALWCVSQGRGFGTLADSVCHNARFRHGWMNCRRATARSARFRHPYSAGPSGRLSMRLAELSWDHGGLLLRHSLPPAFRKNIMKREVNLATRLSWLHELGEWYIQPRGTS